MKKISSPSIIESAGNKPKVIEEYVGRVNSGTNSISIAKMSSPTGWKEPGQKPQFDEYTIVLRGTLKVESRTETLFIKEGEAVIVNSGEWIRYSTPNEGAEYIAICLPAFSLDTVNRD
tara:strand:+ start:587 stop:940 length:354 start_codon:yes stop_codon:yes gene_type:complete